MNVLGKGVVKVGFIKFICNYVIILLLLSPVLSYASTLTLEKVLKTTKKHFPIILAAKQDVSVARAQMQIAKGAFDPTLSSDANSTPEGGYENVYSHTQINIPLVVGGARFYAGYRNGRGNWPVYYQNFLTNTGGDTIAGIDVPILRNFQIDPKRAEFTKAKLRIAARHQELNLVKIEMLTDAGNAYWSWVASAKQVALVKKLLSIALERQSALVKQNKAGDVADIEVTENERFIMQRKAFLVNAKQQYKIASTNLSLYYRNESGQPIRPTLSEVPIKLPRIPKDAIYQRVYAKRAYYIINQFPSVRLLDYQKKIQQVQIRLVKNELLPTLDLNLSADKEYGENGDPLLRKTAYNVGLQFNFPLPQNVAKGRFLMSESKLHQIIINQNYTRQQLSVNLKNALTELENDRRQYLLFNREVNLALKVEQAEMIKFKEGDSSLFLVNQREQTTFSARLQALNAAFDYYIAKLNLNALQRFEGIL